MSEKLTGWKAWVVGIGMILSAIGGWLYATFDGDPDTNKSAGEAITETKTGIDIIKNRNSDEDTATEAATEEE